MCQNEGLKRVSELNSQGFFHAALDMLLRLENSVYGDTKETIAEIYDEKGKLYYYVTDYREAVTCFTKAVSSADKKDHWVKYNIHLATVYRRLAEFDTSHRLLSQMLDYIDEISIETRGLLFLNLSAIQGINGFYEQAVVSVQRSIDSFSRVNVHNFDMDLYNNLGLAYLDNGNYDNAELYLNKSLDLSGGMAYMEPTAALGRLHMMRGNIAESIRYATKALGLVWSLIINYNKEEIALLCHLLANLSIRLGETEMALRLGEKAQVFFGQLGMWRQWENIESDMFGWTESPPSANRIKDTTISFSEIRYFLNCLDAMNSQELIHKTVSKLLDTRVHYVKLLANVLKLPEQDQEDLILTSRFADYGLTALENEVALDPHRSEMAFEQYKQHPSLSVRMVQELDMRDRIGGVIMDHHESYDGTGYPSGKKQDEIDELARVFSIVDKYSTGVVIEGKTHSEVINEILEQRGKTWDPNFSTAFANMFT